MMMTNRLNAMAQSEGDEARPSERPAPRREGERRVERGNRNTEPARQPQEEKKEDISSLQALFN